MTEKEESMKLLISEGRHSFMNVQRPMSCAGKTNKTPLSRRKRALSSEAGYLHIMLHYTSNHPPGTLGAPRHFFRRRKNAKNGTLEQACKILPGTSHGEIFQTYKMCLLNMLKVPGRVRQIQKSCIHVTASTF